MDLKELLNSEIECGWQAGINNAQGPAEAVFWRMKGEEASYRGGPCLRLQSLAGISLDKVHRNTMGLSQDRATVQLTCSLHKGIWLKERWRLTFSHALLAMPCVLATQTAMFLEVA